MGSKFRIKRVFRPLVVWIAKQFQKIGISPNQVSLLGFLLALGGSLIFGFLSNYWGSFIFAILIFTAGIFDGVDGTLARLTNKVSNTGGYYDSVMDRYADAFIVVLFLGHYPNLPQLFGIPFLFWILLALTGVIIVSYIRVVAEATKSIDCDVGIAARSERLFILVICALLNFAYIGLILVGILSHLTALYRIYFVYQNLRGSAN